MDLAASGVSLSGQLSIEKIFEVVGINDLVDPDYMAYMLKYDSTHGKFDGTVSVKDKHLVVNGKTIRVTAEKDPANLMNGRKLVAEICNLESTGLFLDPGRWSKAYCCGRKESVDVSPC